MDNQQLQREFDRIKEKVEKMTGERGDAKKSLSTIRRSELNALASLSLQSMTVSTTPTAAQYNALRTDVANIYEALQRISNLLGNATIPKI